MDLDLGLYRPAVEAALEALDAQDIIRRIWSHDHTVWKPDPEDIANRLGWLHSAVTSAEHLGRLEKFRRSIQDAGYKRALLLGMGGSSLAPELFNLTFGYQEGYPALDVLDSTAPAQVLSYAAELEPAETLFVVASKSGTTTETLSFFKFFYNWTVDALGDSEAGAHFVAITDPGSHLVELANRHRFRELFLNDPNIGGRYSALSFFGLVPAALVGTDLPQLLRNARTMASRCGPEVAVEDNPAARLGAMLGQLARAGRDKATFVISPQIAAFADWTEQLLAESTGKGGTGILPVVREPLGPPSLYGDDRLFVHIYLEGDTETGLGLQALEEAGHPVLHEPLPGVYDLGGQFFLWEMATAIAGHLMAINPFDQPNVESAKVRAREMVAAFQETGELPSETPILSLPGVTVYGDVAANDLAGAITAFLAPASGGDYIALQAFVDPRPETTAALQALRLKLRDQYRLATTLGYGPRFLHSTGQLHKGDAGNGFYLQFTADHPQEAAIPDTAGAPESSMGFGTLIDAQALGDRKALLEARRPIIRFHLGEPVGGNAARLTRALEET